MILTAILYVYLAALAYFTIAAFNSGSLVSEVISVMVWFVLLILLFVLVF